MTPTKELSPVQLVPIYVRNKKSGRDQLRFFPLCSDCGKVLFNIAEANLAVVDGGKHKLERLGVYGDLEIFRQTGRALAFCWECDRKKNRIPWQNALGTFRELDEPQRFPLPIRKGTKQ
jgi:hypothetical protein